MVKVMFHLETLRSVSIINEHFNLCYICLYYICYIVAITLTISLIIHCKLQNPLQLCNLDENSVF